MKTHQQPHNVDIPPVGDADIPRRAMVLAAGLGRRMRPITMRTPKPLVKVRGVPVIDWTLDRMAAVGLETCVVNVHHLADEVRAHLARRTSPRIVFSDETARLMDTGGGVKQALPHLGDGAFYVVNGDVLWLDGIQPALTRLAEAWDPARMDMLLLVLRLAGANGYDGRGDFFLDGWGRPRRRKAHEIAPFVHAGVLITTAALFEDTPDDPFSLNLLFNRAMDEGRLYAVPHDGEWYHVGTPSALALAEERLGEPNICSDQ
ncbi:nucleotidyltransferase family protein [Roseospira navarrensis]|uniref:NTP transferase domain-containing protein n=1 Tax=Roseospira navarrensis TaxID=140058 RepID=A0A7X2D444_9PROT|nr:nucleotidyltransferase family protein [Roseospira navarrensis]MQX37538.1 NTP transferase domain-containing protein [Roseospira navarrensis]